MFHIPERPAVPAHQQGTTPVRLRYDDIAQDGRVQFEALPAMLGEAAWRSLIEQSPLTVPMREQGIVPILARMVFQGSPGPFSVDSMFEVDCCYAVGVERDAKGTVSRLFLNMWADARAPHGFTYGPLPDGPPQLAGRLFAEHIFTRPFGDPAERKVVAIPGHDVSTEPAYCAPAPLSMLNLPPLATALDAQWVVDPTPVTFGLCHTDANQHVNSMVYPRLVEDAALRAFRRHNLSTVCLMRGLEMVFRKPCFAGETLALALRAFTLPDGRSGVVALLLEPAQVALLPDVAAIKARTLFCAAFEA